MIFAVAAKTLAAAVAQVNPDAIDVRITYSLPMETPEPREPITETPNEGDEPPTLFDAEDGTIGIDYTPPA